MLIKTYISCMPYISYTMWYPGFVFLFFCILSLTVEPYQITDLSRLLKWNNLHNWWLPNNFLPDCIYWSSHIENTPNSDFESDVSNRDFRINVQFCERLSLLFTKEALEIWATCHETDHRKINGCKPVKNLANVSPIYFH